MKSLTLSTGPLSGDYISGWEVSECDTWPHKRPRLAEECRCSSYACDARGLVSETSISDRFLSTLPFCFFVWTQRSPRGLSDICVSRPPFLPLLSFFDAFVHREKKKKKTANVKSSQSTSNRRCGSFSSWFLFFCPLASVLACFPSVSSTCRSFYIRYLQNRRLCVV